MHPPLPRHAILDTYAKQQFFAIQALPSLAILSSAATIPGPRTGFFMEISGPWFMWWVSHGCCLPSVNILTKHPFPWSQPASPLSSLSTQAESRALSYDIAELIMLLYWFCEPLSHGGGHGGWAQHCVLSFRQLSFQPWSFCFESGSFWPRLDFQRSNVPAHFVLNELALPWSPHWIRQHPTWVVAGSSSCFVTKSNCRTLHPWEVPQGATQGSWPEECGHKCMSTGMGEVSFLLRKPEKYQQREATKGEKHTQAWNLWSTHQQNIWWFFLMKEFHLCWSRRRLWYFFLNTIPISPFFLFLSTLSYSFVPLSVNPSCGQISWSWRNWYFFY